MKVKVASFLVKFLISVMIVLSILLIFYILPIFADQVSQDWQEIIYLKQPLLLLSQGLMSIFIVGLIIIIYLIHLFDKGRTFSKEFVQKVNWLVVLCVIAVIGLIVSFVLFANEGGPGPGGVIVLFPLILAIGIVAAVLTLISSVITQAITLKEENELTV